MNWFRKLFGREAEYRDQEKAKIPPATSVMCMRFIKIFVIMILLVISAGCMPVNRSLVKDQAAVDVSSGHNQSLYRIAFIAKTRTQNSTAIVSLGSDGKGLQLLTKKSGLYNAVSYRQDGNSIAYSIVEDITIDSKGLRIKSGVYTMAMDGSDIKKVTEQNAAIGHLSFSPDGQSLCFDMADTSKINNVFLIDMADLKVKQLTQDGGEYPSWINNKRILFSKDSTVYSIGIDGLGQTKVAELSGSTIYHPSLSPKGDKILFSCRTSVHGVEKSSIYVFNETDSSLSLVRTEEVRYDVNWRPKAIWSPTGDEIIFLSHSRGICRMNCDGSNVVSTNASGSGIVLVPTHAK